MIESFSGDWLTLREGFDARARNMDLAMRLSRALPARPRIVDLGCGTGSLFRWLAPIIGRAQAWVFADADAALLDRALDDTQDWAEGLGLTVTTPGRALLVHAPGGAWRIETLRVDLAAPLSNLKLAQTDAVTCSALLDLVSAEWMERFCAMLHVPLLACLNVDGRDSFLPPHRTDHAVLNGFRRDQSRDKGFGRALGLRAPAVLAAALAARGFDVRTAASDWRIGTDADAMLEGLVLGHADAALRQPGARPGAIHQWTDDRLAQARRGRLAIRIGHRDCLALPNPG